MKRDKRESYEGYGLILLAASVLPPLLGLGMKPGWMMWGFVLYWAVFIGAYAFFIPRVSHPVRIYEKEKAISYAVTGAGFFLVFTFVVGVASKTLARSPYDHSPSGMAMNLLQVMLPLIARENTRAYLLGCIWRRKHPWGKVFPTILLTLILAATEVNYGKLASIQGAEAIFVYVVQDVLPIFTRGALLSVLVFFGGAKAGIGYQGGVQMFLRLFPFIPELNWLWDSVMGIAFPVLYSMMVLDGCRKRDVGLISKDKGNDIGYVISLILSVACVWFCVGVFPVYPSVILTGSMEPGILPGDAVIIHKIRDEEEIYRLEEGQIINFKRDDISITHRIVEVIYDEAGNVSFRTKGDNNQSEDARLVLANEINGTVDKVVPKVGLGVLILKRGETIPTGVVEEQ